MKQNAAASIGRPREFDRDAALRVAMKLFSKYGYEGVSISDLTRAIGIVPTSLYAAFGNKEKLYRETLALALKRPNLAYWKQDCSVRAWIFELLREAVRDAIDPEFPGRMVTIGMLSCGAEYGALAEMVSEVRARNCEKIRAYLARAMTRGELPADTNTLALSRYLMALMQGIAIQAHDGATSEELLAIVDVAIPCFLLPKNR